LGPRHEASIKRAPRKRSLDLRSEPAAETDLCGLGTPTVNGEADPLEIVMPSAQPKADFKRIDSTSATF